MPIRFSASVSCWCESRLMFARAHKDSRIPPGVFQLRFGKFEFPVTEPLALVDRLIQVTRRDHLETMASFNVTGANQLACQQIIEQPTKIDAEIVLDKLRVK